MDVNVKIFIDLIIYIIKVVINKDKADNIKVLEIEDFIKVINSYKVVINTYQVVQEDNMVVIDIQNVIKVNSNNDDKKEVSCQDEDKDTILDI